MPLDIQSNPTSLDARQTERTPVQIQNEDGMRRMTATGIDPGFLSIMAVETPRAMTTAEFNAFISGVIPLLYGISPELVFPDFQTAMPPMQLLFADNVPQFEGHRIDLHATAHLRAESVEPIE